MWAQIFEPDLFGRAYFLTGDMSVEPEFGKGYYLMFSLFGNAVTALAMLTAEICVCVKSPASTIIHPVCSVGFVVNNIPFFTLNFSIVLIFVASTATTMGFFEFLAPFWLSMSVVITTIFVTNKGARAHVASRMRQQIDRFTIGRNNTAHPIVEIALVPLRSLNRSAPTLPTSTRVGPAPTLPTSKRETLCPVEAFECKQEGGVDSYVCKVEDIELLFEDSEEDEDVKEEKDRVERRMDSEEEDEEVEDNRRGSKSVVTTLGQGSGVGGLPPVMV